MNASATVELGFDHLLREETILDAAIARAPLESTRRLLAIALAGLVAHGVLVGGFGRALGVLGPGAAWSVPVTLACAFLGGISLCLPAFFLTVRLAGYRMGSAEVVAMALRTQALASVLLMGALPFAAALLLPGLARESWPSEGLVIGGLLLPFALGGIGLVSVYRALQRHDPALGRLGALRVVGIWAGFVAAVAPVAFARVAETLIVLRIVE